MAMKLRNSSVTTDSGGAMREVGQWGAWGLISLSVTLVDGKSVAGEVELGHKGDEAGAAGGECSAHALGAINDGVA